MSTMRTTMRSLQTLTRDEQQQVFKFLRRIIRKPERETPKQRARRLRRPAGPLKSYSMAEFIE